MGIIFQTILLTLKSLMDSFVMTKQTTNEALFIPPTSFNVWCLIRCYLMCSMVNVISQLMWLHYILPIEKKYLAVAISQLMLSFFCSAQSSNWAASSLLLRHILCFRLLTFKIHLSFQTKSQFHQLFSKSFFALKYFAQL